VRKARSVQKQRRKALPECRRRKSARFQSEDLGRFRPARILSVCDGIGIASLALQRIGLCVEVRSVEIDAGCRAVTEARFPANDQSVHDVLEVLDWPVKQLSQVDLLVGGFPCQDVSTANKTGAGLKGNRSGLFMPILELVRRVRLGSGDFLLECTDFVGNHTSDFRLVGDLLGVAPVILCASDISAGRRQRAFWSSFPVDALQVVIQDIDSVLEPGRMALKTVLPTVMASGIKSWNTARVVRDERGKVGPLLVVEMERQMGFPDGFTELPGVSDVVRHHQIGNAFHAGVIEHVLRSWVKHGMFERRLDPVRGFPVGNLRLVPWGYRGQRVGEADMPGPCKWAQAVGSRSEGKGQRGRATAVGSSGSAKWGTQAVCYGGSSVHAVNSRQQAILTGKAQSLKRSGIASGSQWGHDEGVQSGQPHRFEQQSGGGKKKAARWKGLLPDEPQAVDQAGSIMERVGGHLKWGTAEPVVLGQRQGRNSSVEMPEGLGFKGIASALRRDFVVASKSPETWKQYNGWKRCFWAWLEKYGLDVRPQKGAECFNAWVDVLSDAVAVMAICYAVGTLDVFVSAVSCYMTHGGMASPFECKEFSAMMEGIRRWKGLGKKKKPPVEPWHVREILEGKTPLDFQGGKYSGLQLVQAKLMLVVGWQLFTRPQDFYELDRCDIRPFVTEMAVTIRYAKNDVRGLTRTPRLSADGGEWCPKRMAEEYFRLAELEVQPGCDKVEGEPTRCSMCPAAFPPIWKHGGVQRGRRIPKDQVTLRIKSLFKGLAEQGVLTLEEAKEFSGKSLRCGGVSSAAAECIRDGVVQGHGGWLTRQSLRHYDLMKPSERSAVSSALNKAMRVASRPG
jgi:hypothetical protein